MTITQISQTPERNK